jgi:hypothetical protein
MVGELSLSSEHFRRLWARQDIYPRTEMPTRVRHPLVGDMTLSREKLAIDGVIRQRLVVYHAKAGTETAEKLALLSSLAAPARVG